MTKKDLLKLGCVILVVFMLFAVGCGGNNDPEPQTPQQPPAEDPQGPNEPQPVYGGTLKMIGSASPRVMGHPTETGHGNHQVLEGLIAVGSDRQMEGVLATFWEEDPDEMTMTFTVRPGVYFHDGSYLNAEVVKWNFDIWIEKERMRYREYVDEVEIVDEYTIKLHLNYWHNQMMEEWGIRQMFSKQAWETNDEEWFNTNIVGTGPFKLDKFERGASITYVKNENYWREGYPYLDAIEILEIPEPSTAAAMLETGEVHAWLNAPAKESRELMDRGIAARNEGWAGLQTVINLNNAAPSPFADKKLREAVEYAIDKESITRALGYGFTHPIHAVAPPGDWGGDKVWRSYDPDKAAQLIVDAGYPDGLDITLLAASAGGRNETAETIMHYLNEVGFNVNVDLADAGRYGLAMWSDGWDHLIMGIGGQDRTYFTSFQRWWGHHGALSISFIRPAELLEMSEESLQARTEAEMKEWTETMVHYIAENALVVPLWTAPSGFLHNGKVHTSYPAQGFTQQYYYDVWLEQ